MQIVPTEKMQQVSVFIAEHWVEDSFPLMLVDLHLVVDQSLSDQHVPNSEVALILHLEKRVFDEVAIVNDVVRELDCNRDNGQGRLEVDHVLANAQIASRLVVTGVENLLVDIFELVEDVV